MQEGMTPEENEAAMQQAQIGGAVGQQAQASAAAQYYVQQQEKNLAETQLDVEEIISKTHHLLKQDVLEIKIDGTLEWKPIKDKKEKALTDWGVNRIMQAINFYVNKNTLLSNFNEEQINRIMLRFVTELNDLVLLKYQVLFCQPTFEECKEILESRLKEKKEMKIFALEIAGLKGDEEQIKKEILGEIEQRIEYELGKIKEEQRKEKLREYGLLMAQIESMIYATYNRAFRGEERGSIRRHTNISEIIGSKSPQVQNQGGMFGWLKG